MKVRMLSEVSGYRMDAEGKAHTWPEVGGEVELPDAQAQDLINTGSAVASKDWQDEAEARYPSGHEVALAMLAQNKKAGAEAALADAEKARVQAEADKVAAQSGQARGESVEDAKPQLADEAKPAEAKAEAKPAEGK